jgi:hypothetical protein
MAKTIIYKDGKDTGEATGPDESYAPWIGRQLAIGLGETPGSFATLAGLLQAGTGYLWDRKGGPTDTEGNPVGKSNFHEYMLNPEGGKEKLDAYNKDVLDKVKAARPNASPEEINKRFEEIQKHSKKYYEETTPFYRPAIAFGRKWGQRTNEILGDERLPGEKTQADNLLNIAGGAAPMPARGVLGAVSTGVGKVAGRTAGKVATNVVEAATPVTFIPGGASKAEIATRVGANIALPAAVDQGVRAYKDDPSVVADAVGSVKDFYTKDDGSADVTRVGATGIVGTILGGLAARRRGYLGGTKIQPPSAGPTSQSMTEAINPVVNPTKMELARAGSDVEPAKVMAEQMGHVPDAVDAYMTQLNRTGRGMPQADHANWWATKVTPIVEQFTREDPAFINKVTQHFADKYRSWGDTEAIARTTKQLNEAQAELATAQASRRPNAAKIQKLQDDVNAFQAEQTMRRHDADPNLRHSMMTESRADVQARLRQSSQDPKIRQIEAQLHSRYDDIFDEAVAGFTMSPSEAHRMKMDVRKGNYHLTDNPLAQKSWIERTGAKFKDAYAPHLVNSDPNTVLSLYRSATRDKVRKGYMNASGESRYSPAPGFEPHPRVNNPTDPFAELSNMSQRVRQAIAQNKAMSDYTDMMKAAPKNANEKYLEVVATIPEHQIRDKLNWVQDKLDGKGNTAGFHYAYRSEGGSLILVRHNEKHIDEMLKFAPAAVIPVMNETRKLTQAMFTGPGAPSFGLFTSNIYDMLTGSLLRHRNMAYGPISYTAARMFGMGSVNARVISAIAAGPEAIINVFASYPYYVIKAAISEFGGNILAKRWEADLAARTGIGKIPGAQQILGPLAKAMSQAYDTSWTNLTKMYKTGHVANSSDEILSTIQKINAITAKRPEYKAVANSYLSMLQVMMDAPKTMALSQNLPLFRREVAKGRKLSQQMSEDFIKDQARIIGGDMARISGNPAIQKIVSVLPWSNPAQQSLRYMKQRIKEAPVENLTRLASFGLVAAWAYNQVGSDKESNNWFYNELPNEIRSRNIPIPNPIRFLPRMMGIDVPRGTPQQENILIPITPEMMVWVLPVIHFMRGVGAIENKDVVVPQTLSDDMKQARDAVFGLATPPLVQGIAGQFGKKVELGKLTGGESPFRDIKDFNFGGANKDKMSPQSRIAHSWYDTFNGAFGTVLTSMLEGVNVGDIHTRTKGGSVEKGIAEGASKVGTSLSIGSPVTHHIWPETSRRYIYTPIAEKLQKDMAVLKNGVEAQMSAEPGVRRALTPNARINTLEKTNVAEGAVVGSPVGDPNVRALMAQVHVAFFSGPYLKLKEARDVARSQHQAMTVGTDPSIPQSPLQRHIAAQGQAKKINDLDRRMYTIYSDQWKVMKTSPNGKAFEAKYGPLTPENLTKAIQESSRQAGDERPR